jgi:YegS/Rv2252/BmrU family lipid kinase
VEPILLVTNAAAGTNEQEAVDAVVAVLREGAEVEVAATGTPEELDDVLSRLDGRWVVAAGGDGTLHALVNALWRSRLLGSTTLGLIPLGTGNDFARGVEIPLDPEQAARLVIAGKATETDLIVDDEDTVIVNNVHLGVGAQASRKAEKWKPRFGKLGIGRIGYAVGALSAGLRPRFLKVEVEVDGVRLGGRELTRGRSVAQVAIGNGSHVGGGTELIPGADPTSGRLVVIVSRNRSIWSRLSYLVRLRVGTHHLMREVTQVTGTEVSVRGEKFYCVADGEISGPHTQKSWRLHRGAVSLLRP